MADTFEIIGMGDTEASTDGRLVSLVLETQNHGPKKIVCAAQGLEILIGALTALLQESIGKGLDQGENEKWVETVPIAQMGCSTATNSFDVILSPILPSGSMLNLSLHPELARDVAQQLSGFATEQIAKRN